jgi:hypothetical protein
MRGASEILAAVLFSAAPLIAQSAQSAPPLFFLSAPVDKTPAQPASGLVLAWTRAPGVSGYIVEISPAPDFKSLTLQEAVRPDATSFPIPDDVLSKGTRYFWRVIAQCGSGAPGCPSGQTVEGSGSPYSFSTAFNVFERLENAGFTLQRAVAGDDATEGAEFGFLKSFGDQTVFTADFALIWDHFINRARTPVSIEASWEGHLASDESESPDAWRYRVAAVMSHSFLDVKNLQKQPFIDLVRLASAFRYETSQDLTIKKVMWENVFTVTSRKLGAGVALPSARTTHPVQFRWRPYLGLDWGHTTLPGNSEELESMVLRIVPRIRAQLRFNAIAQALNITQVVLYVDDTFYALPLEEQSTHNYFVSGFEFDISENIGVGLTYKNGEPAPRFARIETIGGVLSIRFGR